VRYPELRPDPDALLLQPGATLNQASQEERSPVALAHQINANAGHRSWRLPQTRVCRNAVKSINGQEASPERLSAFSGLSAQVLS
jgi:hypothetical protein